MFFCETCRGNRDWPKGLALSQGICEVCSTSTACYNVPTNLLPTPQKPGYDFEGSAEYHKWLDFLADASGYPGSPNLLAVMRKIIQKCHGKDVEPEKLAEIIYGRKRMYELPDIIRNAKDYVSKNG